MSWIWRPFSLIVASLTFVNSRIPVIFVGLAILAVLLIFKKFKELAMVFFLSSILLISIWLRQQYHEPSQINPAFFTWIVEANIGFGKYSALIESGRYLLKDDRGLVDQDFVGEFMWGGRLFGASPWWVVLVKHWLNPANQDRYAHRLFMRWFFGQILLYSFKPLNSIFFESLQTSNNNFLANYKNLLLQRIFEIYPQDAWAILAWMLIGDRSHMRYRQYRQFVDTGLVHILVVSGGNLMILLWAIMILLFFVPFYLRLIIGGVVISLYFLLVWWDSSVLRAWIMAMILLFSLAVGKEFLVWRILWTAWILMLLFNPRFLIYDLGFLLSFGALSGIIVVVRLIQMMSKFNFFQKVLLFFGVPLGAFLWVAPILLFWIGEINLLSVLLNILVVPLVPLIMIWGFLSLRIVPLKALILPLLNRIIEVNQYGINQGIWLKTTPWSWRSGGFLLINLFTIYLLYKFLRSFLPKFTYQKLYQSSQGHQPITDQIKL